MESRWGQIESTLPETRKKERERSTTRRASRFIRKSGAKLSILSRTNKPQGAFHKLNNNILLVLDNVVQKNVVPILLVLLTFLEFLVNRLRHSLLKGSLLLLHLQDLLQSENILSLQLVQLRLNVSDRFLHSGNDHIVQSVHTTICNLDGLIERDEGGLQRRQTNDHLKKLRPDLCALFNLTTSTDKGDLIYG